MAGRADSSAITRWPLSGCMARPGLALSRRRSPLRRWKNTGRPMLPMDGTGVQRSGAGNHCSAATCSTAFRTIRPCCPSRQYRFGHSRHMIHLETNLYKEVLAVPINSTRTFLRPKNGWIELSEWTAPTPSPVPLIAGVEDSIQRDAGSIG